MLRCSWYMVRTSHVEHRKVDVLVSPCGDHYSRVDFESLRLTSWAGLQAAATGNGRGRR
jgi:hypothetical protein